jgi:predicted RNA-binding protein YlxR (DUF448 family)
MLACLHDYEPDQGPRRGAAVTRLCVATREIRPTSEMIRFVLAPDRAVVPDLKHKLPGRGVWVTARRSVLADAISRGAFQRGFKSEVKVSNDLPASVERLIERWVLDALAIAHKASEAITGFAKVEAAIETGRIVALLHARGASADGRRKIAASLQQRFGEDSKNIVTIAAFTSTQLDLALGRPNVVHAALLAGRASDTVLTRWLVLDGFRMGDPEGRSAQANECKRGI